MDQRSPDTGAAMLYFHGGGFIACGPHTHRRLVSRLSAACGMPVLSVRYRQLPQVAVVDSIGDCLNAYRHLLDVGHAPQRIVIAGDSAGGHLVFAVAIAARDSGLPQPAGIVGISPWIDLIATDRHTHPNVGLDPYVTPQILTWVGQLHSSRFGPFTSDLSDPGTELAGLPPALIQVGGLEILLADAEHLTDRLEKAGVSVRTQVYPGQMHVFHVLADLLPEGRQAVRDIAAFTAEHIPPEQRVVPSRESR